jgi:hypothetical protein
MLVDQQKYKFLHNKENMELTPELISGFKEGGAFFLVALVLWYFMNRYEKLFVKLDSTLNRMTQRLTRIETKMGLDDHKEQP